MSYFLKLTFPTLSQDKLRDNYMITACNSRWKKVRRLNKNFDIYTHSSTYFMRRKQMKVLENEIYKCT